MENSRSEIEIRIIKGELKKPILSREQILFWRYKFRNTDVAKREQRQRLVDTFINAMYLYDDKIVVTFNYKDGAKIVKLSDVKKMLHGVDNSDLTTFGRAYSLTEKPFVERICGFRFSRFFRFGDYLATTAEKTNF